MNCVRFFRTAMVVAVVGATLCSAAASEKKVAAQKPTVCEACLRADVGFLASDALRGRGSGTPDEMIAAEYVASVFRRLGLEPTHGGHYIIPVTLERMRFTEPPQLKFTLNGNDVVWTHGKEMLVRSLSQTQMSGKLIHVNDVTDSAKIPAGSIVALQLPAKIDMRESQKFTRPIMSSKAAALIVPAFPELMKFWEQFVIQPVETPVKFPGETSTEQRPGIIIVRPENFASLMQVPDGAEISIGGPTAADPLHTRNVVGILNGSDSTLKKQYVMFSAHMDHLGICRKEGDTICNGADDDASGTATVLELARIFAGGPRPKRSVMFVAFGSEELGLFGSRAFAGEPPVPLDEIVTDIEFEQTALPEPKTPDEFWMTGSQLSTLRAELIKHRAVLADDPFPGNPYFRQSDNYSLAAKGVVAHTISGAANFPDYHQPGDEVQKLNFGFLKNSLQGLLPGFEWLVNSDFKPEYLPGKNPAVKK